MMPMCNFIYVIILVRGIMDQLLFMCCTGLGKCGECCRKQNILTSDSEEEWCSNYCCKALGNTYCCDVASLRAPEEDRLPFCTAWFSKFV